MRRKMQMPLSLQQTSKGRYFIRNRKLQNPQKNLMSEKIPIVIMGATAVGKTELALVLARKTGGEIISADSRQIYKHLCFGTAKPKGKWIKKGGDNFYKVQGINYHLVDFLSPALTYDVFSFCKLASKTAEVIKKRNKIPIFTGGTGMYIQTLFLGLDILPPADKALREKLTGQITKCGNAAFYAKLKKIDPVSALKIPPGNAQRLIRAMEVYKLTGRPISGFHTKKSNELPAGTTFFVLLNWDKKLLHKRIEKRTQNIFSHMVVETKNLLKKGYKADCPAFRSLGYREILQYIDGSLTKLQALEEIIRLTKSYAKRQITWFKRYKNVFTVNIDSPKKWQSEKLAEKIIDEWGR
jgi:tRNA dimethylallyltransferase